MSAPLESLTFIDGAGQRSLLVQDGPLRGWLCRWGGGAWITVRRASEREERAVRDTLLSPPSPPPACWDMEENTP